MSKLVSYYICQHLPYSNAGCQSPSMIVGGMFMPGHVIVGSHQYEANEISRVGPNLDQRYRAVKLDMLLMITRRCKTGYKQRYEI